MDTRSLLSTLGFQEDWDAITDQAPAYIYDFGTLQLTAAEVFSRFYQPVFLFGGVIRGQRSIQQVQFEIPLEIDSFEQGVAWISYCLGDRFRSEREAHWLDDGRKWGEHLPWMRNRTSESEFVRASPGTMLREKRFVSACTERAASARRNCLARRPPLVGIRRGNAPVHERRNSDYCSRDRDGVGQSVCN